MLDRCPALVLLLLLLPVTLQASAVYPAVAGTVEYALTVPDSTRVTLSSVSVDWSAGCYHLLRDPWYGGGTILLYACVDIGRWWVFEVSGVVRSIPDGAGASSRVRVLIADSIRVHTDREMRPCPPYPQCLDASWRWPYMVDVPVADSRLSDPPPPASSPPPGEPAALTAEPGTIPWAKITGGTITLAGKVVTATFTIASYQPEIGPFYVADINEDPRDPAGPPMFGFGFRVVPRVPVPVEPGFVVTLKGSVVDGSATGEAWFDVVSVECTGSHQLPRPVGTRDT